MIRARGDKFCFWGWFQIHYLCTLCDRRSEHKRESLLKTLRKTQSSDSKLRGCSLPLGTLTFLDLSQGKQGINSKIWVIR